eukprot:scaffold652_cov188-Chaetoceros_neogracile.AAC.2
MDMFTTRNKEGWTDFIDAMMSDLFELEQRRIEFQGLQPGATVEIDEFDESKYGMCVIINRWNAAIRPFHTALGERGGSTCFGMRGWKIMHYKVREYEAIHTQGMKLIDHVNTMLPIVLFSQRWKTYTNRKTLELPSIKASMYFGKISYGGKHTDPTLSQRLRRDLYGF